ncbi:MAG: HlyD family efflux transporter periplasmic adaptor subunit [Chitinispirillaceae bacterium]|nr:HlyD family efflux transporter periplasmic adaptor subunit [Chitinispirillaceae bacterium]
MKKRVNIIVFLSVLIVVVSLFSCKKQTKAQHYTTTLEGKSIHVPSLTGGIINQLKVKEGDWVEIGDTLAILDTRELNYQIEQLEASIKELDIQISIAQNNFEQSKKDLAYTQERLQRTQRLVQMESLPKQNQDDLENMVQKAQTLTTNATQQIAILQASKDKLLAQKKILQKKVKDAFIISPASGRISTLYFYQGEAISPFGNLLEIINTKKMQAKVYVPERILPLIKIGYPVKIITEDKQTYPAQVILISNRAEFTPKNILTPDNRTSMVYAVTLSVENPNEKLKDGMPIDVEF